jgi:hypothetical protein
VEKRRSPVDEHVSNHPLIPATAGTRMTERLSLTDFRLRHTIWSPAFAGEGGI